MYSKIASTAMSGARYDLTIRGSDYVLEQVGEKHFFEIHRRIRENIWPTVDQLSAMKLVGNGARYVLFARIEADKASNSHGTKQGRKSNEQDNVYSVSRDLLVHLDLYDTTTSTVAGSGLYKSSITEDRSIRHEASRSLIKDIRNTVFERALLGTYPKPISIEHAISETFREIAYKLPIPACYASDDCSDK